MGDGKPARERAVAVWAVITRALTPAMTGRNCWRSQDRGMPSIRHSLATKIDLWYTCSILHLSTLAKYRTQLAITIVEKAGSYGNRVSVHENDAASGSAFLWRHGTTATAR